MRFSRTLSDLGYWPRQHAAGFWRLWQFNGPLPAIKLTVCNLLRIRRLMRVRLHGFELWVRTGTPDLAVALDSLGPEFEPVIGLADPGGLIIDAGGYIGTAALKLAAAFPASRVITLEPAAENLAVLRRNVQGIGNIVVMKAALATADGEAMLHDTGRREWGFSLLQEPDGRVLGKVATVSIESILTHQGADRLFLLKLDIEGAEREILGDSGGWMGRTEIVIAELHEAIAPGAEAVFAAATAGRQNRHLPGEKMMSERRGG